MQVLNGKQNNEISLKEMLHALENADLIFFGEVHHQPFLVDIQQQILAGIIAKHSSSPVLLGLEWFNLDQQSLLDSYLNGDLSWEDFVLDYQEGTEGFDLTFYRPLLEYAKNHGVLVKGMFIPRPIAARVVREGLDKVLQEQSYIDASAFIPGHEKHFEVFASQIQAASPMMAKKFSLESFFAAQVLKDNVMAQAVVQAVQKHPNAHGLFICGSGHIDYGYGVLERVKSLLMKNQISKTVMGISSIKDSSVLRLRTEPMNDFVLVVDSSP